MICLLMQALDAPVYDPIGKMSHGFTMESSLTGGTLGHMLRCPPFGNLRVAGKMPSAVTSFSHLLGMFRL